MTVLIHKNKPADVTLLLEGTYPYVHGGVSSWVNQMICGLSHYTFSLVFIGSNPSQYGEMKYKIPDNVVHLEVHYLMEMKKDINSSKERKGHKGNAEAFQKIAQLHKGFREKKFPSAKALAGMLKVLGADKGGVSHEDFLYSEEAWEYILDSYKEFSTDPSFIDYFWTIRTMHAPIFVLDKIARNVPDSQFLHTISTGYAGFLGALISLKHNRKLLISEHGIYTKERKIDLFQADWITDHPDIFAGGGINSDIGYLRQLWVHFFEGLGRVAYESAESIISLYEGNRLRQLDGGADIKKTAVIPNGIQVERFLAARESRSTDIPMVVGLVGRVVSIKDIKTFIRAMHAVCSRIPEAEGWIVGPDSEDEDYANECKSLAVNMGLGDKIRFLGMQNVVEIFPQLGVNVLTSISEALPLVLLEGYASGVPAVATDVGACRELIFGSSQEDKLLGASGEVVPIANPDITAEAIIGLLTNSERWHKCQAVGIERVETFYREKMLFDEYNNIYQRMLEK
ncbi:MAG: glycosyl transferase family 1 [Proteobacteria bacterium]|nr:MAG: glycosyl transferase family 1 [Pseudomonadota bacterium]